MGNETLNINVNYLTDEFDKQKISLNAKLGDIARKIQLATKPASGNIAGVGMGPDCNAGVSNIMSSINDLSKTLSDLTTEINDMVEAYEWAENYAMGASEMLGGNIKYTENSMGGGNWNTIRDDNIYAKPGDEFTVKYIAIYADGAYKYNMILGSEELSLDERIADLKKKGFISENAVITVSQGLTKKQADGSLGDIGWLEQVKYVDPEKNKKKRSGTGIDKYEKIDSLYADTPTKAAVQDVTKEDESMKLVEQTKYAAVFKENEGDSVSYTISGIVNSCQNNQRVPGDLIIEDIHGKRYYFQADTSKPEGKAYDVEGISKLVSELDGEVKIETNYSSKDGSKTTTTYTGAITPLAATDINRDGKTNISDYVAAQQEVADKQSQIDANNAQIKKLNSQIDGWERDDSRRKNSLQTSTHGYDIGQAKAQVTTLQNDNKKLQGEIDTIKGNTDNIPANQINGNVQDVNSEKGNSNSSNESAQTTTGPTTTTGTQTAGTTTATTTTTTTTAAATTTGVAQTTGPATTTGAQTGGTTAATTTTTTTTTTGAQTTGPSTTSGAVTGGTSRATSSNTTSTTAAPGGGTPQPESNSSAQTTTGPAQNNQAVTGGTSSATTSRTTSTTAAPGGGTPQPESNSSPQTTTGPASNGAQTGGTTSGTTTTTTAAQTSNGTTQTTTGSAQTGTVQTGGTTGTSTTTTTTTVAANDDGIPSELSTLHKIYPNKTVDELWKMKNDLDDWEMPGD